MRLEEPIPGVRVEDVNAPGQPRLFPDGPLLYDPYLAAQRQSRTAAKLILPAGAGKSRRIESTLGLHRPLVRWNPAEPGGPQTEVEFEAAVFARFDVEEEYDLETTDWRFGLPIVRRDGDVAWKIHLYHLTSHLGDEYIDRTGAKQVAYHLEEAAAGISWDIGTGSRVYGEAGATIYGGETTKNGRFQCGFEWVGAREATGLSPFFAADLQAKNEQEWTPSFTIAAGIAYGRHVRIGAEYFQGRDPHTQFLMDRERWVAVVLSFDY